MRIAPTLALLTLGSWALHAPAADRARTLELLLASRADQPIVGLFKEAVRARLPTLSEEQSACWQRLQADVFQQAAVDYLARTLSDSDVTQGLEFYATPLGRKLASRNHPDRGQPEPIGLTRQEYAREEAFSLTRAGHELLAPNGLLRSAEVKKAYEALFARKWRECGAAKRPE